MEDYDKNEEPSYLNYWNVSNLYRWAMSQKLPVDDFKWVENIFHIHLKEKSDGRYFLEVAVQYPKKLHNLHNDLPFLPERMKIQVFHGNCLRIFLVKTNMLYT